MFDGIRGWYRTSELRMIVEYLTIGQAEQIKHLLKRELRELQKSLWAYDFFMWLAIFFLLVKLYVVFFLCLMASFYFKIRSIRKSGVHIHYFRKRYLEKAKKEANKQ